MNRQELTTRFDKNLAHNTYDFNKYKEDATLIRNLVVYLAFSYQEDLWGYGTLDPVKFAKHMGYKDHRSLYKKVSQPAQFDNLSEEEVKQLKENPNEYVWDDLLDNALYKMAHQPLSLSFGGRAASGENFYGIKTMLILTRDFLNPTSLARLADLAVDRLIKLIQANSKMNTAMAPNSHTSLPTYHPYE